jgi:hypothetical protein
MNKELEVNQNDEYAMDQSVNNRPSNLIAMQQPLQSKF